VSKKQKQTRHISRGRVFTPAAWLNHLIGTHLGFLLIGPGFFSLKVFSSTQTYYQTSSTVLIHNDTLQNRTLRNGTLQNGMLKNGTVAKQYRVIKWYMFQNGML
jgi:hypothetical protein